MTLRVLRHAWREERGWSLIEVLVAGGMMAVVLGAALSPLVAVQSADRVAQNRGDSLGNARSTIDDLAHRLRNVAGQSTLVDRASPYDLVIQTPDTGPKPSGSQNARSIMRVRYCVDTTHAPASASNGILWEQDLRWTTALVPETMPNAATCPDPSFTTAEPAVITDAITNRAAGQDRPLFTFLPAASPLSGITSVGIDLFTDRHPGQQPGETHLTSSVFLRNQNGPPTASATVTATGAPRQVTLNAAASSDPENLPLSYRWCDLSTTLTCDDTTKVGSGELFTYTLPGASGSPRNMVLQVFDAGGLETDYGFTANAS